MKKSIAIILSIMLVLAITLPATAANKTAVKSITKKADISFFHWRNEDKAAYDAIIANFEKENPNITVNMEIIPTDNYYTTLTMRVFAGEDAGDVFAIHPGGELFNVVKAGAYMDLSDKKDVLANYDNTALIAGKVANKQFAVVQTTNPLAMFYNKGIFAKYHLQVPKTWDDFLKVCNTLKINNITPINIAVGESWVPEFYYLSLSANLEKNPNIYNDVTAGKTKITNIDSAMKVLGMMRDLQMKGFIQDKALGTKHDAMISAFAQGKAAMMPIGTWEMNSIRQQNPKLDFGLFNPPVMGGSTLKGVSCTGLLLGVNAKTKNADASLKFLQYMTAPEAMNILCNKTGQLGLSKGIKYDNADLKMASDLLTGKDGSTGFWFHVQYSQIQDEMNTLIVETLGNNKAKIGDLLTKYQAQIDKVIAANKK